MCDNLVNHFSCSCANGWMGGGLDKRCTGSNMGNDTERDCLLDSALFFNVLGTVCLRHGMLANIFVCMLDYEHTIRSREHTWTKDTRDGHQCLLNHFAEIDECKNVVCGGESKCHDGVGNFTCECAPGWAGGGENTLCTGTLFGSSFVCRHRAISVPSAS